MAAYVSTGQAAKMLGVSVSTLQRWDRTGRLVPERTPAGRRRYKVADLGSYDPLTRKVIEPERKTIAYARVSSHDQKPDRRGRQVVPVQPVPRLQASREPLMFEPTRPTTPSTSSSPKVRVRASVPLRT